MKRKPIGPELFEEKVKALREVGRYPSEREALSHSLEVLLLANPTLSLGVAIRLYKNNQVTLEKGSEIAGIGIERFKEELTKKGLKRVIDVEEGEMKESLKLIKEMKLSR